MKIPTLDELISRGDIKPFQPQKEEIASLLKIAERDLKVAEKIFSSHSLDWSLAISYNCVLQAARAWMMFKGFRPSYGEGHTMVIHFAINTLEHSFGREIDSLDSLRKKRHTTVYEVAGAVTEYEATFALKIAKRFIEFIKKKTGGD